ncbi:uncharacterized protein HMPREF1541_04411 [Cyphellophora europaea CBS 101466]|uniref:SET domain-containing protein n=1 Tax=Cyphellophora europaea (strain CBS 101466) TaxID=1220924 RepID=W2RUD7_CYPE1|nr:uncharacterized protein HMPREF1541_04411 [Cyphellophora europaea CBS 101466]ETN40136.1 hypothetical protein HMPREF1541_04411 [Cyphellophora europaea CBS 101466]
MASQQPVTPPRRSSRIANRPPRRVPWLWSPGSASSSRVEEVDPFDQEDQITKLLRNMYQEIDETATTPPDGDFLSRIYTLIRRIRSRRFWSEAEEGYRIDLDRSKAFAASERASIENALAHFTEDIQDSPDIQDEFLAHMVETYGYPLLSICLHSSSFLRLTETGNLDLETKLNKNEWTRIRMRLELIAASLELFAKLRRLDFMAPIRHYEADYKLLLSNVFRKHNSVDRCRNFGISPDEMNEVHIVEPWDIAGKHWALPEKRAEPAEICCIKYTVTQHLNEDYPELAVGEELTEPQEDIQDSIFLGAYRWVNLTQWPSDDPRESGYEDPCLCCGYQRGPVPKRRDGARYPQGCECTFEDLQRKQKSLVGQPLFEIMTSSFLGRCVRALQNLRTGDYLGIYHGEMYPFFKKTEHERRGQEHLEDERTEPRYSGNVNSSYILRQDLDRRHVKNRSKRKTTKKRPRNTGSDDEDTAREMEELDPREWRVYAIDAALKGNFTRFLAHSCDANTRFEEICLAQKKVNVLEVIRPIQFGDSITVDYGKFQTGTRDMDNS